MVIRSGYLPNDAGGGNRFGPGVFPTPIRGCRARLAVSIFSEHLRRGYLASFSKFQYQRWTDTATLVVVAPAGGAKQV